MKHKINLFPNDYRKGNDGSPAYKNNKVAISDEMISYLTDCLERRVEPIVSAALWKNKTRDGKEYLSILLTEPYEAAPRNDSHSNSGVGDDIPF